MTEIAYLESLTNGEHSHFVLALFKAYPQSDWQGCLFGTIFAFLQFCSTNVIIIYRNYSISPQLTWQGRC
jgi:hypothetical protein